MLTIEIVDFVPQFLCSSIITLIVEGVGAGDARKSFRMKHFHDGRGNDTAICYHMRFFAFDMHCNPDMVRLSGATKWSALKVSRVVPKYFLVERMVYIQDQKHMFQ